MLTLITDCRRVRRVPILGRRARDPRARVRRLRRDLHLVGITPFWFAEYRVTLDDRLLTVARRGVAGAGKVAEIPRQWVKTVRAQRGMQAGNKLYYDLKVETADDILTAASSVADYTVAS